MRGGDGPWGSEWEMGGHGGKALRGRGEKDSSGQNEGTRGWGLGVNLGDRQRPWGAVVGGPWRGERGTQGTSCPRAEALRTTKAPRGQHRASGTRPPTLLAPAHEPIPPPHPKHPPVEAEAAPGAAPRRWSTAEHSRTTSRPPPHPGARR